MEKQTNKTKRTLFLERPAVRICSGLLCFILAYVFISWAIDTGSLFDYALAVLLLLAGAREFFDVIKQRSKKSGS